MKQYQIENGLESNPVTPSDFLTVPLWKGLNLITLFNHSLKWNPFHEKEKAIFYAVFRREMLFSGNRT